MRKKTNHKLCFERDYRASDFCHLFIIFCCFLLYRQLNPNLNYVLFFGCLFNLICSFRAKSIRWNCFLSVGSLFFFSSQFHLLFMLISCKSLVINEFVVYNDWNLLKYHLYTSLFRFVVVVFYLERRETFEKVSSLKMVKKIHGSNV